MGWRDFVYQEWINYLVDLKKTWNLIKEYFKSREEYYRVSINLTYAVFIFLGMSIGHKAFAILGAMHILNFVIWSKYVRTGKLDAKRKRIGEEL